MPFLQLSRAACLTCCVFLCQVAASYVNLAGLLKSENRLMEALPYFNKALDIRERAYGPDHPDVSAAQISLAELLKDLGK